jgi:hypothetical protein
MKSGTIRQAFASATSFEGATIIESHDSPKYGIVLATERTSDRVKTAGDNWIGYERESVSRDGESIEESLASTARSTSRATEPGLQTDPKVPDASGRMGLLRFFHWNSRSLEKQYSESLIGEDELGNSFREFSEIVLCLSLIFTWYINLLFSNSIYI